MKNILKVTFFFIFSIVAAAITSICGQFTVSRAPSLANGHVAVELAADA